MKSRELKTESVTAWKRDARSCSPRGYGQTQRSFTRLRDHRRARCLPAGPPGARWAPGAGRPGHWEGGERSRVQGPAWQLGDVAASHSVPGGRGRPLGTEGRALTPRPRPAAGTPTGRGRALGVPYLSPATQWAPRRRRNRSSRRGYPRPARLDLYAPPIKLRPFLSAENKGPRGMWVVGCLSRRRPAVKDRRATRGKVLTSRSLPAAGTPTGRGRDPGVPCPPPATRRTWGTGRADRGHPRVSAASAASTVGTAVTQKPVELAGTPTTNSTGSLRSARKPGSRSEGRRAPGRRSCSCAPEDRGHAVSNPSPTLETQGREKA